ncbi:MAG: Crp/Fnr family transcriptional regulator [Thermoanaerobaculia bacterium]
MRSPYGFDLIDDCSKCEWRAEPFFCDLATALLEKFDALTYTTAYPAGAVLYVEGQVPGGVYVLCKGRVKLTASSSEGKTLVVRIAESGEVLGLSGSISGRPYRVTAETLEPCQVKFIKRMEFLAFLHEHGEISFRVARQLSAELHDAFDQVRSLGLSSSAAAKLGKLILNWCEANGKQTDGGVRLKLLMTHEQIAQMIGTSRETVTRLLSDFRQRQILEITGSKLVVRDKAALEVMANP